MKRNSKPKSGPETPGVAKRSISAPSDLFKAADAIMETRMMDTFSEYVRSLIRKDLGQDKAKTA